MIRFTAYLRQHHVGLIAILLVISGGAAYAVTVPKNSVKSSSIRSGAVKTADIKDRTIRGKDIKDSSVSGADIDDGSISASDLAGNASDEARLFFYTAPSGTDQTVWSDPATGANVTIKITCATPNTVSTFGALPMGPGRIGSYGVEDKNSGGEPADSAMLAGAATVTQNNPAPGGGAGFGGTGFGFGQIVYLVELPTKDVLIDIKVAICSARGSVTITHKGPDTTPPSKPSKPSGSPTTTSGCVAVGAGYCGRQPA